MTMTQSASAGGMVPAMDIRGTGGGCGVCARYVLWAMVYTALLVTSWPAPGAEVGYAYDEKGRLAAVVDPAGEMARYSYDAVGNVTAISRYPGSAVYLVHFAPACGIPGIEVT